MAPSLRAWLLVPLAVVPAQDEAPRSRALSMELTAAPRLAGTIGSAWGARVIVPHLEAAGFRVELDEREVLLSLPRRLELAAYTAPGADAAHARIERFDPDAIPPGDVPAFSAWSASGVVAAPVVHVGRGLREDYERLAELGVEVAGKVALCEYGGSYRGIKVDLAEQAGCAAVLLYTPSSEDGPARGPTWPLGPWKPPWEAQRGSISPIGRTPGDPTTPGWPSPRPGEQVERLSESEVAAALPRIPCKPIGARVAELLLAHLAVAGGAPVGPGPAHVSLAIDQPREIRRIVNVIATLSGERDELVLAGNHRDAWVRGAHDAASGTVTLLRAAELLGERVRAGWRPGATIALAFWDAEESGLIGSTEWVEANAAELARRALVYVNADAAVSGTELRASGTPGLLAALGRVLRRVPAPHGAEDESLWVSWVENHDEQDRAVSLELPGSGSDFAAFLHHVGLPVLDFSFGGNEGGQYHTAFDDFAQMDRHLDPDWRGHETAALFLAELLTHFSEQGASAFDTGEAPLAMARLARESEPWLGAERAARLAASFEALAEASAEPAVAERLARDPDARFYRALMRSEGVPGREWHKNVLWTPGLETGYASETFPTLRLAVDQGEDALEREVDRLIDAVDALRASWLEP